MMALAPVLLINLISLFLFALCSFDYFFQQKTKPRTLFVALGQNSAHLIQANSPTEVPVPAEVNGKSPID